MLPSTARKNRKGGIHQCIYCENSFNVRARRYVMFQNYMCLVHRYINYKASSTSAH